ncbi:NUDIX domain-containing protein [Agromyces sp. MMS24-JH15]|uniref:NUDIX hydrolase n=1 Tax=Agromyces sp. MMS24-JH15 TaxID=3243765 RepID=UPI003747D60B
MATPEFIQRLRDKVGTEELWLSGVTAVVLRGEGADREVLLVRRVDDGRWTAVTGIIDPGEEPAVAAEREVLEETDVVAVAERLAWVHVEPHVVEYENGDRTRYLDLVFACRYVSGDAWPADGENSEVAWVRLDALPPLTRTHEERILAAAADEERARFSR